MERLKKQNKKTMGQKIHIICTLGLLDTDWSGHGEGGDDKKER